MKTAGIVMCGGKSARMGRPKPWLTLGGETLLARTVRLLAPCVSELMISALSGQELPAVSCPFGRVDDKSPDEGPLAALGGALQWAERWNCQAAVVLAVDMPLITTEILRFLLKSLGSGDEAVVPFSHDYLQPLCAVYRPRVWRAIDEMPSDHRSLHALLNRLPHRLIDDAQLQPFDSQRNAFRSMNTPEEYEEIRRIIEKSGE